MSFRVFQNSQSSSYDKGFINQDAPELQGTSISPQLWNGLTSGNILVWDGSQWTSGTATGTSGTGMNGNTILNGVGPPSPLDGVDGDFYIDTASEEIFGPKNGGLWGGGTSLIGSTGPTGSQGVTDLHLKSSSNR